MKKTVAKVVGILSIALLTGSVAPSGVAVAYPNAYDDAAFIIPNETAEEVIALEARRLSYMSRASRTMAVPTVIRNYSHPSMHGYKKSVYRGKFYRSDQEYWRKCVMDRESSFTYGARNGQGSSAAGAYQFLDRSWRPGLVHMIFSELKEDYGPRVAKQIKTKLMKTPIYKWSREMQDRGFFTVLNYEGKWSGMHHWNATVPGTSC